MARHYVQYRYKVLGQWGKWKDRKDYNNGFDADHACRAVRLADECARKCPPSLEYRVVTRHDTVLHKPYHPPK